MVLHSRQKSKKSGLKQSDKNAERFERKLVFKWPPSGIKVDTLAVMKVVSVKKGVVTFKRIK